MNADLDLYVPTLEDAEPNTLVPVDLIARTYTTNYPKPAIIPGSGHVFLYVMDSWSVLDKVGVASAIEFIFGWLVLSAFFSFLSSSANLCSTNQETGLELERNGFGDGSQSSDLRGGDYVAGMAILPMVAADTAAEQECEIVLFGGGKNNYYVNPDIPENTINSVRSTCTHIIHP